MAVDGTFLSVDVLRHVAVLSECNPRQRNTVARSLAMCNRSLWLITLSVRFRSVELLDMDDAYETADMLAVCDAIGLVKCVSWFLYLPRCSDCYVMFKGYCTLVVLAHPGLWRIILGPSREKLMACRWIPLQVFVNVM